MAPPKRKRNDRTSVDSGDNRPSPHRPNNTGLAQHERDSNMGRRGGDRRSSRGGRGGTRGRIDRPNSSDSNAPNLGVPSRVTPGPMSPPAPRPSTSSHSQPNQQVQAAVPSPIPAASSPIADELRPEPEPYDYSHITDERAAAWKTNGRKEVADAAKQALDDVDILDLSIIFQELIRATLDSKLDAVEAGSCVKEILEPSTEVDGNVARDCDASALFLDCLSIIADSEPVGTSLQRMVTATGISPILARRILDGQLLEKLGLTRNTFVRSGIRQTTNLLYRQSNHNLLREETEGYSKLVTELFTTSGSEPPTSEVVEETFERIKGLIGTFDLDVGRVLDVTLDVFAAVLIKQFRFFIKFLRVSSWWPRDSGLNGLSADGFDGGSLPQWAFPGSSGWAATAETDAESTTQRESRDSKFWDRARKVGLDAFFELGGRQVIDTETKELFLARKSETDANIGPDRQWIEATGTAPPPGNRVAAQLLGFKLRFYASEAREEEDVLPANLIYLAALLVKIGFISLRDLYPHLWPLDDDMEAVKAARMKELAEKERLSRPGGGKNALMLAGALADDTLPNSSRTRDMAPIKVDPTTAPSVSEAETKPKLPEPEDQKVKLLTNLLTIGAIPESLFIIGRFPWLPEAFPEILDLLHRILHHSISKVFDASQISGVPTEAHSLKKFVDLDQSSAPKGHVRRSDTNPRKPLRWPFPDKHDVHEAMVYRFYWDEWADNIPVCQNVDDIFTLCSTLLNISGVNIGKDAALLSKLYSIGNKSLAEDRSEINLARWQEMLKRLLVPAMSLTKENTNAANELYEMLRYYPVQVRYNLYAEWFEGQTSRLPAMEAAFARTRLQTLSTMKRISKANVPVMARSLAKLAYASPGVVFKVALSQIEAYNNLIEVVVECARYFTDLGYDVLVWSLLSSLGGKSRNRTRSDDVLLTSRWLMALSKFAGNAFKRYSIMNPAPVIQYINDQLYQGNATDLIILEELISQMAGIISDTDFTDSQLLAMTGGEKLRKQTLINLQDMRFESEKTAKRLMRSLLDTKLAAPILVSIAQHRQSAVFAVPDDEAHIKYLATLIDETQRILVQYLDLLRSNLSINEFDAIVPDTAQLLSDYGLDPSLAFLIGRASFAHRINATLQVVSKEQPKTSDSVADTDIEGDVNMESLESTELANAQDAPRSSPVPADTWQETVAPLLAAVKHALPETTWSLLSPDFYVIFWQLALPDIHLPMDSYTSENSRLTREISETLKDRSDMTRKGVDKRDDKRRGLEATKDELMKESKQQLMNYERVRARLNKEKLNWFANIEAKPEQIHDALLENCFLPRLLLSPSDVDYCFKLIKFLHNNGTPQFRTLCLYSRIFKSNRLRALIFSCTIREAENLGRFLKQVLGDLSRWHSSKTLYEREAFGQNRDLPGFAKKIGKDLKPESFLDFEEFRNWVRSSHLALNAALKSCLSGMEWMHIRNAVTVLKAVVEYFPAIDFMGKYLQKTLMDIGAREKKNGRDDLSLSANAVLPDLKKHEHKWVMTQAFSNSLATPSSQANGLAKASQSPPSASAAKTSLKPTAPEFKPGALITSNGSSSPTRKVGNEVEDGEVDDAKLSTGNKTTAQQPSTTVDANTAQQPVVTAAANAPLPARETLSRGSTPKPSAAVLSQSGPPPRPESSRSASSSAAIEKPPPPSLPSRPDVPFPGRGHAERHPPSRSDDRRGDRLGGSLRDRNWDQVSSDRRPLDPPPREPGRYSDRGPPHDRERERERERHEPIRRLPEPMRDVRDGRDARDRDRGMSDTARLPDFNSRSGRTDPMLPPRLASTDAERGPPANSEHAALVSPNDVPINPARAALIHGSTESPRSDSLRPGRDDTRSRPSSRPHSPRRSDRPGDHPDGRRHDRGPNSRYSGSEPEFNRRYDDHLPPSASRSDRPGNRGPDWAHKDLSAFQPTQPQARSLDPDHGRLTTQDSNYGRLEDLVTESSGPPSGPRGNAREREPRPIRGRPSNGPQNRDESRAIVTDSVTPPISDKPPPTGPAGRNPRKSASGQFEPPGANARSALPPVQGALLPSSLPPPPPSVGIHPSRVGIIETTVTASMPSPHTVHPDRLNAISNDQTSSRPPPPIQTNVRQEASLLSPMNGLAPSGPRGHGSPAATSVGPNGFTAPTGPSTERARIPRERQGHHLAGIQSTLLQAGQQTAPDRSSDTRIRGRGIRSGPSFETHASSTPSTPLPANSADKRDTVDRGRDLINPERKDLLDTRGANGVDSDHGRQDSRSGPRAREPMPAPDRPHRPSRHSSHRNSRSRSPDHESQRPIREREPMGESAREHRGRRVDSGRERHQGGERELGRRDGRDGDKIRDMPPRMVNEPGWVDNGGPERGGHSRDMRQSGGGENRRDSRSSRDADGGSGRKRRGDDGGMGMDRGHEKRPRR